MLAARAHALRAIAKGGRKLFHGVPGKRGNVFRRALHQIRPQHVHAQVEAADVVLLDLVADVKEVRVGEVQRIAEHPNLEHLAHFFFDGHVGECLAHPGLAVASQA